MRTVAVYPGTFDPITNGHTDLVERAAKLFDEVVVAIAANPPKRPVFGLDERMAMAREALAGLRSVAVEPFDSLLVDFVRQRGAHVILRGLRAVSDFEYEIQLAGMNRRLAPEVETMFLTPSEQYSYISSSLIREVASLGGDVSRCVPRGVWGALQSRMRLHSRD